MFLGLLTLLVAISISAIAAYYSILGLTAIFAAAFLPIILMGSVLEVGKILTTVWLHQNWKRAPRVIKFYLTTAVVVLMFITSMGVFGFLSKAHIEQTALSVESNSQIERIESEIARYRGNIERAELKIKSAESSQGNSNEAIQQQIDKEQDRIDNAYSRIEPLVQAQNKIIQDCRPGRRVGFLEDSAGCLDPGMIIFDHLFDGGKSPVMPFNGSKFFKNCHGLEEIPV